MAHRKQQHHTALKARLERSLADLYHNATLPLFPVSAQNEYEEQLFEDWLQYYCESQIAYIQAGGAYPDYQKTYQWIYNRNFLEGKSAAYAERLAMKFYRNMQEERARCNSLDSRQTAVNALYEEISNWGTLYQYGRGGRTLAPDGLISGSSYNWHIRNVEEVTESMPYEEQVRLCMVLESFNTYVEKACEAIPEEWEYYKKENDLQEEINAHENMKPHKVTTIEWR